MTNASLLKYFILLLMSNLKFLWNLIYQNDDIYNICKKKYIIHRKFQLFIHIETNKN